jgi:flavin reductase (DIM6/NTAB) family NADH-FMN oxidoreductase RutF
MTVSDNAEAIDPKEFRRVLGHYPTGVTVVTANGPDGPAGFAVGTFASVSLDPPLVSFYPDKSSSTWPAIEAAGSFCVNVLAEDQAGVCGKFASKEDAKFAGIPWHTEATGAPVLDDVLAWIDCDIEVVHEAGDHWLVIGRVRALDVADDARGPLLFFKGGYGAYGALDA